jgi:hypothetical protein
MVKNRQNVFSTFVSNLQVSGTSNDLVQCHCYNFVHENVGNPALHTRPTILKLFLCIFTNFIDGLAKSLISYIYCQNIRL